LHTPRKRVLLGDRVAYRTVHETGESPDFFNSYAKAIEEKNADALADTNDLKKQKAALEKQLRNLIDFVEKSGFSQDINDRIKERQKDIQDIDSRLFEYSRQLKLSTDDYERAVESFGQDTLNDFNHADGSKQRDIYRNVLHAAMVKGDVLRVYKNGKGYRILMPRRKNSVWQIETWYRGEFQEATALQAGEKDVTDGELPEGWKSGGFRVKSK